MLTWTPSPLTAMTHQSQSRVTVRVATLEPNAGIGQGTSLTVTPAEPSASAVVAVSMDAVLLYTLNCEWYIYAELVVRHTVACDV